MNAGKNLQPEIRQRATDNLSRLSPSDRERLLIKCWMSHDARWFMAVAQEFGIPAASHLNQIASRELGKAEALRMTHALGWSPPKNRDDFLLLQEAMIAFLGPDLLDYQLFYLDEDTYRVDVQRCFAHENVARAGVAEEYACGIFARIEGWLEALEIPYQMTPALGPCLMAGGRECTRTFVIGRADGISPPG